MIEFDLIIDGERLNDVFPNVFLTSFEPEAPSFDRKNFTNSSRHGIQTQRKSRFTRLKERKILVDLTIDAANAEHFYLVRSEVYEYLGRPDPYEIICTFRPERKWLVVCDDAYTIGQEQGKTGGTFTITLTAIEGCSQSVHDSRSPQELQSERFMGRNFERYREQPFRFKERAFSVYNYGDVRLSPIDHEYTVNMFLAGTDIKIENKTTGESITLVGTQSKNNLLNVIKQYVFKGSQAVERRGRFPELMPGKNDFVITGATYIDIEFITHFYYKGG
ncbi:phage tail domain-containing protein [Bacillus safensis]|uniref:phage tail domain-containing protein n=1 Tax=Bacillus safensis TaxID=561879 RepID=UPI003839BF4D